MWAIFFFQSETQKFHCSIYELKESRSEKNNTKCWFKKRPDFDLVQCKKYENNLYFTNFKIVANIKI